MPDGSDRPFIKGFQDFVLIGKGGSASVYSAEQVALNRRVAVKVVEATADQARRFSREMLALGALATIPHVVTLHAVEQTSDGRPALIMPLMEDSLGGLVTKTGRPCSLEDTLRWAGQLAIAIDQAHAHNIFHRDIKPENVLISKFGEAHLADFGIATLEGMTAATVTTLSLSPPYAPPERFSGGRVDPKAGDIYSFAATLYSVLAGRPPFGTAADGGTFGLASRIMDDRPAAIAGVGDAVNKALRAGLAKDPEKRPSDAHSLVAAMGSATKSNKRPEHGREDRRQDRHQDRHREVSAGVYLDEVEARVGGKYDVAVPDGVGATEVMAVLVPPLVEHGKILRIGGGTGPDVAVSVHVAGSSPFGRVGNDLTMVVPVKASELRKGAKIEVPTIDGSSVAIRVPADTPTGRTFRVVGAGRYRRDGVGDLLVTLVSLGGAAQKNKGRLADYRMRLNAQGRRPGRFAGSRLFAETVALILVLPIVVAVIASLLK